MPGCRGGVFHIAGECLRYYATRKKGRSCCCFKGTDDLFCCCQCGVIAPKTLSLHIVNIKTTSI